MPPLRDAELSAAQRAAAAELTAGPRGGVVGPFIAALRSPELMTRLQRLGEYLRYRNALGPRLTELAILITARAWSQPFEWAMHVGEAEARVILKHEHNTNQVEVTVAWRHHEVAGQSEHADLFTAVHAAVGKVHAQVARQREKARDAKRVSVQ